MGNHLVPQKKVKAAADGNPLRNSGLPIIFILGGPGAGKGELHPVGENSEGETIYSTYWLPHGIQCERLSLKYNFLHISIGDLLRKESEKCTERGFTIDRLLGCGEVVPVSLLLTLIIEKMMSSLNFTSGFILEGFPRDKSQTRLFEKAIRPPDLVIYLKANEDFLKERLLGRAVTSGRKEDNDETIDKRIKLFARKNHLILKHYDKRLWTIEAERDMEIIFNDISAVIDNNVQAPIID